LRLAVIAGRQRVDAISKAASQLPLLLVGEAVTIIVLTVTLFCSGPLKGVAVVVLSVNAIGNGLQTIAQAAYSFAQFFVVLAITIIVSPVADFVAGAFQWVTFLRFAIHAVVHHVFTRP
jgi:hypothetical protein